MRPLLAAAFAIFSLAMPALADTAMADCTITPSGETEPAKREC